MATRTRLGAHQKFLIVREMAVTGPGLVPIDDDVVAVYVALGPQGRQIRSRPRFRKALTPHRLAFEDPGQVSGFLSFAGPCDKGRTGVKQAGVGRAVAQRYWRTGTFLEPDQIPEARQSAAAVGFGPIQAGPPTIIDLALHRGVIFASRRGFVGPRFPWRVFHQPRPGLLAEQAVCGCLFKIHRTPTEVLRDGVRMRSNAARRSPSQPVMTLARLIR